MKQYMLLIFDGETVTARFFNDLVTAVNMETRAIQAGASVEAYARVKGEYVLISEKEPEK